ncbi:AAA family ATPase [uncultured Pontibacter sp.]|uniref:AAA family ATPase n=1 Tax=uncultured Pontibacter sp. TaxID=453356 RepID=UPI00260F4570|nr:AAA family ATPase [uncultured Pontibacter sp.]
MLIKRIKARNYKTYLNLDLNIAVQPDRPIILIGGANGGGKTTFFEAIYGALYGLHINTSTEFKQLLNAGAIGKEEERITLELHFSGLVINQEQQYVLTRTYVLNPEGKPVESVKLNMNGSIFQYGTATPYAQRVEQEAQVNKIIKANLPKELSRYFLFDAMEAGNLLKEDQLNRVIRENIENVMGFNKYMSLSRASENLLQQFTAQRLQIENEKKEYLALLEQKKAKEAETHHLQEQLEQALEYSVSNKHLYESLKTGMNQEETLKSKIEQAKAQVESILRKENLYHSEVDEFVKNIESHVALPKLAASLKQEVALIFKKNTELQQPSKKASPELVEKIVSKIADYLQQQELWANTLSVSDLVKYVMASEKGNSENNEYGFLEQSELKSLEQLVNSSYKNTFPALFQQQLELNLSIPQIDMLQTQAEQMKAQIAGSDYTLLKHYEDNEGRIKQLELQQKQLSDELKQIEKRLHQYDIQTGHEPDPKYDTLQKLRPFFEDTANQLLKAKKQQIEAKMKNDLNLNLAAYRDVIDRVELSENLKDLTFKIYHKAGNEIYLNQLNTASKQVVVQVLLKALHEYGDYDPPVMIDTVMGVLDETSRTTLLENYFPQLSHQTILLSSDSEIRPEKDLAKIEAYVSKVFTLQRDREEQCTQISEGYFGKTIED